MYLVTISREELSLLEKIAARVVKGQNSEQIAIDANLDTWYVERILATPEFEQTFQTIDPVGFRKWRDSQVDLREKKRVMTMAQEDSVEHYKMARDLIRGSKELSDKDKLNGLLDLLKFARVGEGHVDREVVELSDDALDTILEAWGETEYAD